MPVCTACMPYGITLKRAGPELARIMKRLEERHASREFLLKNSRETVALCSRSIISTHKGDIKQGVRQCEQARAMLKEQKRRATGDLRTYLAMPEQELTEAACLIAVVQNKSIPTSRLLGVSEAPYVLGLLDAIGEMKRMVLDMLRAGRIDEAVRVFGISVDLYDELSGFVVYNNSVRDIRKKIDAARITIDSVRDAVTRTATMDTASEKTGL